jgi:hypothetical protein
MMPFVTHAAWTLLVAFTLSLAYEIYRVTVKAGTSPHDSPRTFVVQLIPFYLVAGTVVAVLFAGFTWSVWVGLVACVLLILLSIFYYNPRVMLERKPGMIDWFEDLAYTGLLFVAAAQLAYGAAAGS